MNNELAASLIEISYVYRNAGKTIPDHLVAELQVIAGADSIAYRLRNDAARLLSQRETA